MALRKKAEEYFSSINSMANRMCVDMEETKVSYENLWQTLTFEEQQQILNQTIIKPEVSLKYPLDDEESDKVSQYAIKVIVDDNYAYRDEHSAPFSFRTSSQRDLLVVQKSKTPRKPSPKILPVKPVKVVIPNLPVNTVVVAQDSMDNDTDEADTNSLTHMLPKTGLDLLDNW